MSEKRADEKMGSSHHSNKSIFFSIYRAYIAEKSGMVEIGKGDGPDRKEKCPLYTRDNVKKRWNSRTGALWGSPGYADAHRRAIFSRYTIVDRNPDTGGEKGLESILDGLRAFWRGAA